MKIVKLSERKDTERGIVMYKYLDKIANEDILDFTIESLNAYSNESKLIHANRVADVVFQMLEHKNLVSDYVDHTFVDILISAALLHNLFYNDKDWRTLFDARQKLLSIAESHNLQSNITDALFATIEGQLGERTPVTLCIPKPGTPTDFFASAYWFVNVYKSIEK